MFEIFQSKTFKRLLIILLGILLLYLAYKIYKSKNEGFAITETSDDVVLVVKTSCALGTAYNPTARQCENLFLISPTSNAITDKDGNVLLETGGLVSNGINNNIETLNLTVNKISPYIKLSNQGNNSIETLINYFPMLEFLKKKYTRFNNLAGITFNGPISAPSFTFDQNYSNIIINIPMTFNVINQSIVSGTETYLTLSNATNSYIKLGNTTTKFIRKTDINLIDINNIISDINSLTKFVNDYSNLILQIIVPNNLTIDPYKLNNNTSLLKNLSSFNLTPFQIVTDEKNLPQISLVQDGGLLKLVIQTLADCKDSLTSWNTSCVYTNNTYIENGMISYPNAENFHDLNSIQSNCSPIGSTSRSCTKTQDCKVEIIGSPEFSVSEGSFQNDQVIKNYSYIQKYRIVTPGYDPTNQQINKTICLDPSVTSGYKNVATSDRFVIDPQDQTGNTIIQIKSIDVIYGLPELKKVSNNQKIVMKATNTTDPVYIDLNSKFGPNGSIEVQFVTLPEISLLEILPTSSGNTFDPLTGSRITSIIAKRYNTKILDAIINSTGTNYFKTLISTIRQALTILGVEQIPTDDLLTLEIIGIFPTITISITSINGDKLYLYPSNEKDINGNNLLQWISESAPGFNLNNAIWNPILNINSNIPNQTYEGFQHVSSGKYLYLNTPLQVGVSSQLISQAVLVDLPKSIYQNPFINSIYTGLVRYSGGINLNTKNIMMNIPDANNIPNFNLVLIANGNENISGVLATWVSISILGTNEFSNSYNPLSEVTKTSLGWSTTRTTNSGTLPVPNNLSLITPSSLTTTQVTTPQVTTPQVTTPQVTTPQVTTQQSLASLYQIPLERNLLLTQRNIDYNGEVLTDLNTGSVLDPNNFITQQTWNIFSPPGSGVIQFTNRNQNYTINVQVDPNSFGTLYYNYVYGGTSGGSMPGMPGMPRMPGMF